MKVSSWGNIENEDHNCVFINSTRPDLSKLDRPILAYGMGRSYGDVCLNPSSTLIRTESLDRYIDFDIESGVLTCESGVLLRDIQKLMIPQGWILPVSPGSQIVTVGGAIANDVHGKNHHVHGTFCDHITNLVIVRTEGDVLSCNRTENSGLFYATIGGLGLTGVIVEATLQLKKVAGPWLETETIPYYSLDDFFQLADMSESEWEYTVSWIDCFSPEGRGVFSRSNHTSKVKNEPNQKNTLVMPFTPPMSLVNKLTLKPFNKLYFFLNSLKKGKRLMFYEDFLYPLDHIQNWNRMYGIKGFYQYQIVVPHKNRKETISKILSEITRSKQGSFLAVLKTFGNKKASGLLSFPIPGVTLALDFPNLGVTTLELFNRLDDIVGSVGGRVYAAKDCRMSKEMFRIGYPLIDEFESFRDPGISSALSRRLLGS